MECFVKERLWSGLLMKHLTTQWVSNLLRLFRWALPIYWYIRNIYTFTYIYILKKSVLLRRSGLVHMLWMCMEKMNKHVWIETVHIRGMSSVFHPIHDVNFVVDMVVVLLCFVGWCRRRDLGDAVPSSAYLRVIPWLSDSISPYQFCHVYGCMYLLMSSDKEVFSHGETQLDFLLDDIWLRTCDLSTVRK